MNNRSSGILLHPTSLPGGWGIGDLGREAYRFVDFLEGSGQGLWQILPLGPTGHGNSPYQSLSSFAGNPLLIDLEAPQRQGWLTDEQVRSAPAAERLTSGRTDYAAAYRHKLWCLERAFEAFKRDADPETHHAFAEFCVQEQDWLDDFVLFMGLKERHQGAPWNEWEAGARLRDRAALDRWRLELAPRLALHKFHQFLFFAQWRKLRLYANRRNIRIVGDIPVFVAYDGADVWAQPELFYLDEQRRPTVVAGVPPDYFSPTGQLWGNPLFRWDRMEADGYAWWIRRVRKTLDLVDIARLDHFRGFEAYWEVPAGETDAIRGRWVKGPGEKLFDALSQAVGDLPFIAEDLGFITPEVELLREQFRRPGMKVLQFAFGDTAANPYLLHNHVRNCVVYTGTHDNDTTLGWFNSLDESAKEVVRAYLGGCGNDICLDLVRAAFSSVADTVIVPIQDVLRLGSESRMNRPGVAEGNWEWRLDPEALTDHLARELKTLTLLYGRFQNAAPPLKELVADHSRNDISQ